MRVPFGAIAGLFLVGVSVFAQTELTPVLFRSFLSPALIQYLGLTENQATAIQQANNSYQQFTGQKLIRSAQVQREIAEETARPALDPMALGLRYLELEAIRREVSGEETRTRTTVQAILTETQKTKVKALEEAMKLQPLICEAQNARLLTASAFVPGSPSPLALSPSSFQSNIVSLFPYLYGCGALPAFSYGFVQP